LTTILRTSAGAPGREAAHVTVGREKTAVAPTPDKRSGDVAWLSW
jgi:hypothetical protein